MYTKQWKQFNSRKKGNFTEVVTICCTSVAINQITDKLNIHNTVFFVQFASNIKTTVLTFFKFETCLKYRLL